MKRVLIIRLSAIGDLIFSVAFASALRQSYPKAFLAWLVDERFLGLMASQSALDEVIPWPRSKWIDLWNGRQYLRLAVEVVRFRAMLRNRQFDVAIDLQGLLKSGLMAWFSGASRRIGLGSREGSRFMMTEIYSRSGPKGHIASEYIGLAESLGLARVVFPSWSNPTVIGIGSGTALNSPAAFYAIAPFTTRPQKHWPASNWKRLVTLIYTRYSLAPLVIGTAQDAVVAEEIAASAPGGMSVAGLTSLEEVPSRIQSARFVIGVDTGWTHLGVALGLPVVAIFGSTHPYERSDWSPLRVVWLALPCSPCRRRPTCGGAFNCLTDIPPEMVLKELSVLIGDPLSEGRG